MLDWNDPLPLDRIVERAIAMFNAVLPRALALSFLAGLALNLAMERTLGPHRAEILRAVADERPEEILQRFGPTMAALAIVALFVNASVLHLVGTTARGMPGDAIGSLTEALRRLPHLAIAACGFLLAVWGGTLLFVVPGVWAMVAFSFFAQAVLFDGRTGLGALAESLRRVRGSWWRTLALYGLVLIVMLLAAVTASLAVTVLGGVVGLASGSRSALLDLALGTAVGAVAGIAVDCLLVAYYHDLGLRIGGGAPRDEGTIGA